MTVNDGQTKQNSGGVSYNETPLPIQRFREVIQSIEFLSDNQHHLLMQRLFASLPTGQCVSLFSGLGVVHFVFPMPVNFADQMPVWIEQQRASFLKTLITRPIYLDPASVEGQYDRLIANLHRVLIALRPPVAGLLVPNLSDDAQHHSNPHMTL